MISIIIPSHNRYNNLLNAINSVLNQTYKNIEIIVVDDGSSDIRYKYTIKNVKIINLPISSENKLGYPCGAVPRNVGLKHAKGEYIAFLDDDDIWLPNKLKIQLQEMQKHNIDVSCTEGYIGKGFYNLTKKYEMYNKEHYWKQLKKIYNINDDFPDFLNLHFINIHNLIITSSICFKRNLIDKIGYMELYKNGGQKVNGERRWQDYEYWKKMLKHSDCLYIKKPLFYYDSKKY